VPTIAQAGFKTSFSLLLDCTTADAAIAAGDYVDVEHAIEGFNFNAIAQKAFFVSFWVKSTKTGIHCVSFINGGGDRSYVAEYTVNASDTWEYKTIAVPASPSAGTWAYDQTLGMKTRFCLVAGSTFQTTAGSWQTGNFLATANQVNSCDNTANNFLIALFKIVPGDKDTYYNPLTYQESLLKCQRYYWKGLPANAFNYPSYAVSATMSWPVKFPETMRAAPTLNISTTGITLTNTGTPTVAAPSLDGCRLMTVSTAVSNNANFTFAAANYIEADARL
jgi:hypothetical protein